MPTYTFECQNEKCKITFDHLQSVHDEDPDECATCQHPTAGVKRIMGGSVGIRFVGSGFHVNDYHTGGR
jgi:putative FmdB family regulatory protein